MQTMTTRELNVLKIDATARLRDLDRTMTSTPTDTLAYDVMKESRPGLAKFIRSLDDELISRGA